MKLTQKKIRWIIKRYDERMPVSEIAFLTNVTERRVRQIIQSYKEKGRIPMIKKPGRKRRKLTQDEKEIIMKAYKNTNLVQDYWRECLMKDMEFIYLITKFMNFLKKKGSLKKIKISKRKGNG